MEPGAKPIKHILWDWNGTLLDDLWLSVEAINVVLDRYHLPRVSIENYLDIFTFPVKTYYRRLGFDFGKNPFEVVGTEFIREYTRRMKEPVLRPGARDCLARLTRSGVKQSLFSAAKQEMLTELMEFHELTSGFEDVIGQDDHYAHGKTDAGLAWLKRQSLDPQSILFVGDTLHDLDVARVMGVQHALITGGHTSDQRLRAQTSQVFNSFKELEAWLLARVNGFSR
ncbi:MAG: HAD family hydrolase [FCB group bacterium]|nr:HAD family hydrolase [FCB group bacterium]